MSKNSLLIPITVVVSMLILSFTYLNRNAFSRTNSISVKGMGVVDFSSDHIVWEGSFKRENNSLSEAYDLLQNDREEILKFLLENGIAENEIVFGSVSSTDLHEKIYNDKGSYIGERFLGYRLTQRVTIESSNIDLVEMVSRTVTNVLKKGVAFYSYPPRYYYTKLQELKLDLISKATDDARQRAELIAKQAGSSTGGLISSNMGILQILGQYSDESYSWGGTFNTSSRHKTASITMDLTYKLK